MVKIEEKDNPLLNWPVENMPHFNQVQSTEQIINETKTNALCSIWDGLDVRKLGGN